MTPTKNTIAVCCIAAVIAAISAKTHAGSWNDGSRLATVECLVDRHTWIIDESVFLTPRPYGPLAGQLPHGTLDRLYIDGHYYSDKSPVPAVLVAGPYWVWRTCGGPSAAERPDIFCWLMTVCSSGLAFVVFVGAIRLANPLVATGGLATAAVIGSTFALPYCRFVNNHEILLGVTAALLLALQKQRWCIAGVLAGLAYATDLGAGPAIALSAGIFVVFINSYRPERERRSLELARRWRSGLRIVEFTVAALPFFLLHHALNYAVGGTFGPANANPPYFNWPGCPFRSTTISGTWNHASPLAFAAYAVDLLVGKKGFYGHNPIFLLIFPALPLAFRSGIGRLCLGWLVGVWLVYAAGSNNYSGECISVRWFVPMVAPACYLVFEYLRQNPLAWRPFSWLAACGAVLNLLAWRVGPWSGRVLPGYWIIYVVAVLGAFLLRSKQQQLPAVPLARAA